jgi:thiamine pyrophosphokinase
LLNRPIEEAQLFNKLLGMTKLLICTDGAANHLKSFNDKIKPDYIIGDLDSILPETM